MKKVLNPQLITKYITYESHFGKIQNNFFYRRTKYNNSYPLFFGRKQFETHFFYLAFLSEKNYLAFFRKVALKLLVTFDIKKVLIK